MMGDSQPEIKSMNTENSAVPEKNVLDQVVTQTLSHIPSLSAHHLLQAEIISVIDHQIMIHIPMIGEQVMPAMSLCPITEKDIGCRCAVQFLQGELSQPVVMGIFYELAQPTLSANNIKPEQNQYQITENAGQVCIEAKEELVLRCGKTQIVMNAEGIISIRALYLDSQAAATLRLRGGSIQVN